MSCQKWIEDFAVDVQAHPISSWWCNAPACKSHQDGLGTEYLVPAPRPRPGRGGGSLDRLTTPVDSGESQCGRVKIQKGSRLVAHPDCVQGNLEVSNSKLPSHVHIERVVLGVRRKLAHNHDSCRSVGCPRPAAPWDDVRMCNLQQWGGRDVRVPVALLRSRIAIQAPIGTRHGAGGQICSVNEDRPHHCRNQ